MSILKCLSTSVSAKFETLVNQIENHDAVAQTVIDDIHKELAKAKVRLLQLKSDSKQNLQALEQHQSQQRLWKQRALEVAASNEIKALQCLSRAQDCEQKITHYETIVAEHGLIEARLEKEITSTERRLSQLVSKRTQQASANSIATINQLDQIKSNKKLFKGIA